MCAAPGSIRSLGEAIRASGAAAFFFRHRHPGARSVLLDPSSRGSAEQSCASSPLTARQSSFADLNHDLADLRELFEYELPEDHARAEPDDSHVDPGAQQEPIACATAVGRGLPEGRTRSARRIVAQQKPFAGTTSL